MIDILKNRLRQYSSTNALEEEQALKEILQEIALYGLWRGEFFSKAAFQGGTSLRILHGLPRFSEDLDFILRKPDPDFQWPHYFSVLLEVMEEFGIRCELSSKSGMDKAVRQAMLKDDSIGQQLDLSFIDNRSRKKLRIKLEIDTQPPEGTGIEWHYLDFPLDFEVCTQDLPSNYALKLHALLCRPYLKGRDWYDFTWYCAQKISPNLLLLQNALDQYGPWRGKGISVDPVWLVEEIRKKIATIDWPHAAADVAPFLGNREQRSLRLWTERFFLAKLKSLEKGMRT